MYLRPKVYRCEHFLVRLYSFIHRICSKLIFQRRSLFCNFCSLQQITHQAAERSTKYVHIFTEGTTQTVCFFSNYVTNICNSVITLVGSTDVYGDATCLFRIYFEEENNEIYFVFWMNFLIFVIESNSAFPVSLILLLILWKELIERLLKGGSKH